MAMVISRLVAHVAFPLIILVTHRFEEAPSTGHDRLFVNIAQRWHAQL
jgi:hypothetical protein